MENNIIESESKSSSGRFRLGNKAVYALGELINHWATIETMVNIINRLGISRQVAYNWKNYCAKTFSEELLERLQKELGVSKKHLKNYMAQKITLSELWEQTRYKDNMPDPTKTDQAKTNQVTEMSQIPNMIEQETEINGEVEADLQGEIGFTSINKREEEEEEEERVLEAWGNSQEIEFKSEYEIKIAKEIIRLSNMVSPIEEEETQPRLVKILLNKEGLTGIKYPIACREKDLKKITDQVHRLNRLIINDGTIKIEIDLVRTYKNDICGLLYDVKKLLGKQTGISDMIDHCLKEDPSRIEEIEMLLPALKMDRQIWNAIRSGEKEATISEINKIIAICDLDYSNFNRSEWVAHGVKEEKMEKESISIISPSKDFLDLLNLIKQQKDQ